jgi:hypothetical protein
MSEHIQAQKLKDKFSPEYPIMLFPLRVETRFIKTQSSDDSSGTSTGTDVMIGISPSISEITSMVQRLTTVAVKGDDMDAIEKALDKMQGHFATVEYEQGAEKYEANTMTRWKETLADVFLNLYGNGVLVSFRQGLKRLVEKNQATNELLEKIAKLAIKQEDKAILLSKNELKVSVEQSMLYLQRQSEDVDLLVKFTGQGLLLEQENILSKVQSVYKILSRLKTVHPEDWKVIQDWLKTLNQVEQWNEAALIRITEIEGAWTKKEAKFDTIRRYFNRRPNLGGKYWAPAVKNWRQVMEIRERMRLLDQAQEQADFLEVVKQIKVLNKRFESLKKNGLAKEGIGEYTQAEFKMFEPLLGHLTQTLDKQWSSYLKEIEQHTSDINHAYEQFLGLTKQKNVLVSGEEDLTTWVELAQKLETNIYQLVFDKEPRDFGRILETISGFSDLLVQLSVKLINTKIKDGKKHPILKEWLPKMKKAVRELNAFIKQRVLGFSKQMDKQKVRLSNALIVVANESKKLKKIEYIELWKQLQDSTLALKEGDNLGRIEKSLGRLVKRYHRDNPNLANNQHVFVAELLGKHQGFLNTLGAVFEAEQQQTKNWKSFFQQQIISLEDFSWKSDDKVSSTNVSHIALLNFWNEQINRVVSGTIQKEHFAEQSGVIADALQEILKIAQDESIGIKDIETYEKIKKQLFSHLSNWINQTNELIKESEVLYKKQQEEQAKVLKRLEELKATIAKDAQGLLWMQRYQMETSAITMAHPTKDKAYQMSLVEQAQENFKQFLKLRETTTIPSLEYNNELFKGANFVVETLDNYVLEYEKHYQKIETIHSSIQVLQANIDELLIRSIADFNEKQSVEVEKIVTDNVLLANQLLKRLELDHPPSLFVTSYQQLRTAYKKIELHVQFLTNIPRKLSSLPQALEELAKTYKEWYKKQQELNQKTREFVQKGRQVADAFKAEKEGLGLFSASGDGGEVQGLAYTGGGLYGAIGHTGVVCWLPPWPGGGDGGTGTNNPPDPVILQEHELWIRVYPDYVAINSHDPKLTPIEVQAGIYFWTEYWFSGGDRRIEIGAWRILVEKFGAQRAAWIATKMRPLNISQQPKDPIKVNDELYGFLQGKLDENAVKTGLSFWENTIVKADNKDALKKFKAEFEKKHSKGKAALLANITKLPIVSKALNPTSKTDRIDLGSKNLAPETLSAVIKKASLIQLNSQIPAIFAVFPQFPVLDPTTEIKSKAWEEAPSTKIFPDQLVFILYDNNGNLKYEELGNLIPTSLQTGPNPNNLAQFDPMLPDLGVDGDIKWMTDFEEAVAKGMAIKIPVLNAEADPSEADAGFSKVFVLGVKHSDGEDPINNNIDQLPNNSVNLLEELLEGHHYTQGGMSILKPGTATNTTSEYRSPFATKESMEDSFDREIVGSLPSTTPLKDSSDGHLVAKLLGIDTKTFNSIENNSFESIANAEYINTALWMTTWGYFLEEVDNHYRILSSETDPIIPQNVIDELRAYFISSVKGRGSLPVLRVGKQPYGILPTSSFVPESSEAGGWAWDDIVAGTKVHNVDATTFYNNLTSILVERFWGFRDTPTSAKAPQKWIRIVTDEIYTVDDPVTAGNFSEGLTATQERFMDVLRVHPHSVEYYNRYGTTIESGWRDLLTTTNSNALLELDKLTSWLDFARSFGDSFSSFYTFSGTNQVSLAHSTMSNIRWLSPVVNDEPIGITPLDGPIVDDKLKSKDDRKLSPINNVASINYIEWLLNTNPSSLYHVSKAHVEPSKSLLYQSLKNALFNQYWDTCARILEDTKILLPLNSPVPAGYVSTPYKDLMFRHNPSSTNNNALTHRLYTNKKNGQPDPNKHREIIRSFNRGSYREFVIDVDDSIKGTFARDPQYADEVIFANGKWSIMNMGILTNELRGLTHNQRLIDFVHHGTYNPAAPVNIHFSEAMERLVEFRAALDALAKLPTAELEHLFAEHMDLASHRLDAWILGLVNQRLTKMRTNKANGVYLGAYGWLLNLKPGSKRQELHGGSSYHVMADGSIPEMVDPDNQGHIIAPSLNHALAGAVLRSGYNAHLGGAETGTLNINLSSKRIRKALFYLEGIRNGQPLSALLGYQLERNMIEHGLGQYIQTVRQEYPLNKVSLFANVPQTDLHNTIDGMALVEAARTTGYPYNVTILPAAPHAAKALMEAQVDKLFDAIDALSDLAVAEGTYHAVGGNYARAGAMLKALSQQNHIPEPEIIETPRTGQNLTHRVGFVTAPITSASATPQWASQLTTRALTEPSINAWLAQQLPTAQDIRCHVFYKIDTGGAVSGGTHIVSILDLDIEPIDLLYIFPENLEEFDSELGRRFKKYVVDQLYSVAAGSIYDKFVIDFTARDATWADTVLTIEELSSLVYSLRDTLLKARPMTAIDIIHPSTRSETVSDKFNINLSEVEQRVQQLESIFIAHKNQLQNNFQSLWLAALDGFESQDLKIEDDPSITVDYTDQQARLDKDYGRRLQEYQKTLAQIKPTHNSKKRFSLYQEAGQALLGKSFRLLPHFTAHNTAELQQCYTDRMAILPNAQALEVEGWIMGLSRVREPINHLEQVSLMQSVLGGQDEMGLSFSTMQLPYRPNDSWVGLELPANYYKSHRDDPTFVSLDKLSLVLSLPTNFSGLSHLTGLVVDEWTELIPNDEETIGVAFHYDEPNAEPPQAILLALHPETIEAGGKKWDWKQLKDTLHSTLALAQMRSVEPEQLQCLGDELEPVFSSFGHILPATLTRLQENYEGGEWYADYGLNIDSPVFNSVPMPPTDGGGDDTLDPDLNPVNL